MDKIIVITGGTSGIGLELKNLFVNNGDKVFTVSSREMDDENHYSCDISNELKVKQVINDIGSKFGRIDMLINCAGYGMSGISELIPTEQIERLNNVDYYGTLYTIRSSIHFMQPGAKIINLSSAMALFPIPFRSYYGAVKAAILNLSFSLRMELAPLGIDVVAICPGDVKTNFTENRVKEQETNERYGNRLKSATEKSDSREEKRMPCDKCAAAIFKKLMKQKCKPFYIIGGKYNFLYFLTSITPKSWLLNITGKLYGGKFEEEIKKDKKKKNVAVENATQENPELSGEHIENQSENAGAETTMDNVEEKEDNPFANLVNSDDNIESGNNNSEDSDNNSDETDNNTEHSDETQEETETEEITNSEDNNEENKTEDTQDKEDSSEPVEENKEQGKHTSLFSMVEKLQNKESENSDNE